MTVTPVQKSLVLSDNYILNALQYDLVHELDYILMEDLPGVFDQLLAVMMGWTD